MCFERFDLKHRVAKRNITCYKIMIKEGTDKVNSYHYRIITGGYKLGEPITPFRTLSPETLDTFKYLEGQVVHAWDYKPTGWLWDAYCQTSAIAVMVKCIIPKGTPYWRNPRSGKYAALCIIPKEIIKPRT